MALKDLRTLSRRLTAFSTAFSDELRLLERIYYKGKNQHMLAIFWRKVVDTRRLGARINEMDIPALVEGLRYAFYDEKDRTNSKVLHDAWKQSPDATTCTSVLKRLRSACLLIDKAQARFLLAYGAFKQQLRAATFLPLIVTLISITSRLHCLLSELRDIIALQWRAVTRTLEAINVAHANGSYSYGVRGASVFPPSMTEPAAMVARTIRPRRRAKGLASDMIVEDFGSRVLRGSGPSPTLSRTLQTFSVDTEQAMPIDTSLSHDCCDSGQTLSIIHRSDTSVIPVSSQSKVQMQDIDVKSEAKRDLAFGDVSFVERPDLSFPGEKERVEGADPRQGVRGKKQKRTKTNTKKQRDEIDDIFGI